MRRIKWLIRNLIFNKILIRWTHSKFDGLHLHIYDEVDEPSGIMEYCGFDDLAEYLKKGYFIGTIHINYFNGLDLYDLIIDIYRGSSDYEEE